jgi:acyl carrier protein
MQLEERLIELVGEETGNKNVTAETRLEDLGIDSLDFVDLMMRIEQKFKPIPKEKWGSLDTVGDILAQLA